MGKNLVLLANSFPFGLGEAYLETEVKYYNGFENVFICSLNIRSHELANCRALPDERFHIIPVPFCKKTSYLLNSVRVLFNIDLYTELLSLIRKKKVSIKRIIRLFVFLSRADKEKRVIIKFFKDHCFPLDNTLIYSYRFEYQAYLAILLAKDMKGNRIIARAHGYDLYEERNDDNYLPLRERILSRIDKLFLVSQNGVDYISKRYPQYRDKLAIERLGTLDYGFRNTSIMTERLEIVSCSNVVPVKRLDLLVDYLSMTSLNIHWTHFGGGDLINSIISKSEKLPENIKCTFMGAISHDRLMKQYSISGFQVFINLSESEGVPVSIMEAMSFGIPCIATDVGGTKEIIDDGINGFIIPKDFSFDVVNEIVEYIYHLDDDQYMELRRRVRKKWSEVSSADINYRAFNMVLNSF